MQTNQPIHRPHDGPKSASPLVREWWVSMSDEARARALVSLSASQLGVQLSEGQLAGSAAILESALLDLTEFLESWATPDASRRPD